jgi:hypothetical protein
MDISQVEQVGENVFCGPSSTVLVANDVNVSIFKSAWFGRNQVISEDEMLDDVLISPGIVQIPTRNFQVIIVPNRIQFFLPPQRFDVGQQEIDRVLGTIVRLLPHTPYTAIGLNFEYIVTPPSADTFYEWNRKWFSAPLVEKFPEAKDKTSRFGSYFSMDSLEMRLKIDIKPVNVTQEIKNLKLSSRQEFMRINFNFHEDLPESPSPDFIIEILKRWTKASETARNFAANLSN